MRHRRRSRPRLRRQARQLPAPRQPHFDTDRYYEFCASALPDLDALVLKGVSSPQFDTMLSDTVRATYPAHENDRFPAHSRGSVGVWVSDEAALRGSR